MLQILVKDNNVDYALKALKRKLQREGVFRSLKVKRFHEKPSQKKARKIEEAMTRRRNIQYKFDLQMNFVPEAEEKKERS